MTRALTAPAQMLGVELARPGAWSVTVGDGNFTAEMLRDAADFYTASGGQAVPIRLGHKDSRFNDGEPTFGSVTNIRYLEDDRGPVLLGDIVGMPGWLAASAPSRWPNRSVQGWQNVEHDGREYSLTLSALAFLGAVPPAVRNIKSLADLQNALAASSATPLFASAPEDDPATPPQVPARAQGGVIEPVLTIEPDPVEAFIPGPTPTPDPADEAVVPPTETETGMDPAKFREAVGLDDLTDDEVMAALAKAGFVPKAETPETAPEAVPVAASARRPEKFADSMIRVEASAWEENQERIKRLEADAQRRRDDEADQIIIQAIKDGKFAPARKDYWTHNWKLDPEGAREAISSMQRNMIPVAASGYAGDGEVEEDELDREIARLSDPTRRAANRG